MTETKIDKSMPPPPENPIVPERVAGAQERWEQCPLRDCKNSADLLYSDFYLRDRRTNRLMCNACTVRTDAGYIAREVVRSHDNRFYTGDILTDGILFAVMLAGSLVTNVLAMRIDFYYAFIIGGAVGAGLALTARRLAKKKVTRQTHYIGTGGIIFGAIFAPVVANLLGGYGTLTIDSFLNISLLACTVGMVTAAWGVFLRRISFRH